VDLLLVARLVSSLGIIGPNMVTQHMSSPKLAIFHSNGLILGFFHHLDSHRFSFAFLLLFVPSTRSQ
jgi:hypothetical protein